MTHSALKLTTVTTVNPAESLVNHSDSALWSIMVEQWSTSAVKLKFQILVMIMVIRNSDFVFLGGDHPLGLQI